MAFDHQWISMYHKDILSTTYGNQYRFKDKYMFKAMTWIYGKNEETQ